MAIDTLYYTPNGGIYMSNYGTQARKVKQGVFTILESIPETRNNDKLLMLTFWERYDDADLSQPFGDSFMAAKTPPESIRRARQQIQNTGLFLPTNESVLKTRRMLQQEATAYHATN